MILRPKRLATALAADELSERDKLSYLLVWALIGIVLPSRFDSWRDWNGIFTTLSFLITAIGLLACFRTNVRGDNRAFLERYLCLSVPLGVISFAAYYVIYYAIAIVGIAIGWVEKDAGNWDVKVMAVVSSMNALILYFLWMRAPIATAAGVRAA